jgi:hypothetical protein
MEQAVMHLVQRRIPGGPIPKHWLRISRLAGLGLLQALALGSGAVQAQEAAPGLTPAASQELVAIKPGLMCRSADALAQLTLPNGDSRTHSAARRPHDLALAASGGCIDIPPNARVTVRQAFHNTSIVTYGSTDGAPYVVPNIDFEKDGQAGPPLVVDPGPVGVPAGYAIVSRLAVGDAHAGTLALLLDRRITPRLRDAAWGAGDPGQDLKEGDPLQADFNRLPPLNARLRLLSETGDVMAEVRAERPLAKLSVAPIHGLPDLIFDFEVDYSAGMGGFSGPAATLLDPAKTGLAAIPDISDTTGKIGTLEFASSLHALWQIVPARHGGPEEIESAICPGGGDGTQVMTLSSYRFRNGQWHGTDRRGAPCSDLEVMPPRTAFP